MTDPFRLILKACLPKGMKIISKENPNRPGAVNCENRFNLSHQIAVWFPSEHNNEFRDYVQSTHKGILRKGNAFVCIGELNRWRNWDEIIELNDPDVLPKIRKCLQRLKRRPND